ncbi:related to hexose transporter protein [Serendipita indica DSM 11827]|uniref:Related to hexose transporter protein n=1 Tax=Serendipita indica (strain DSM 11827) TaxID=1109443 RepID=G4T5R5_SERID|nr:related to hexose transporter protein [Serendipita indica DSM 11827]
MPQLPLFPSFPPHSPLSWRTLQKSSIKVPGGQIEVIESLISVHSPLTISNPGIRNLNFCLALVILASAVNGYDSSVLNGLQILPEFKKHFNSPDGSTLGFMSAAQNFGGLIMLPIAPYVSDGIGRRKTLSIGAFIIAGGAILQALSANVGHFIASRGLIGLGITLITNAAPVLTTELAYPTQRGSITALYNTVWYFGSIISAWVCYATLRTLTGSIWMWRLPCLFQSVPAVFMGIAVLFIPESPRWLTAKGRDQEAIAILAKYHANGRERDPLVYFTYGQIREALAIERQINQTTSYLTLFKSAGNLRRMRIVLALGFFSQWSGNGLVSYYLDPVLENVGVSVASTRALINGGIQIWCLFVAVTAAMLVDKVGRRPLFLMSNAGMVVVFICWTITTALWTTQENRPAANASIAMIPIYFLTYSIAYTPMLVSYTVEILPYSIRARGFAMMNLTVGIGITTNQFVNPIALKALGWKLDIVYCCWLFFELVYIFLFLVETKGKTLEETAALFDGKEVVQNIENVGNEAAHQRGHRYRPMEKTTIVADGGMELAMSRRDSNTRTAGSEENAIGGGGVYGARAESRNSTNASITKTFEASTPSSPVPLKSWR